MFRRVSLNVIKICRIYRNDLVSDVSPMVSNKISLEDNV